MHCLVRNFLSAENDEIIRWEVDTRGTRGTTRHATVRNSCSCPTQTYPYSFLEYLQHLTQKAR